MAHVRSLSHSFHFNREPPFCFVVSLQPLFCRGVQQHHSMKRLTVATFACIALLAAGQLLRLDSIEAKRSLGTLAAHFQSKQAAKRWYPPPLANDDVWNKAKCKGNSLNQAFSMSSEQAGSVYVPPRPSAQSEFRDFPGKSSDNAVLRPASIG